MDTGNNSHRQKQSQVSYAMGEVLPMTRNILRLTAKAMSADAMAANFVEGPSKPEKVGLFREALRRIWHGKLVPHPTIASGGQSLASRPFPENTGSKMGIKKQRMAAESGACGEKRMRPMRRSNKFF